MNEKLEVNEFDIYCLLKDLTNLLDKKTLRKNKSFLKLCNSIICLSHASEDKYLDDMRHKIFTILKEQGLYKGL